MDFVFLIMLTVIVLVLCDKNNSPEFLSEILYNSEFKEENESSDKPKKKAKDKSNKEDSNNSQASSKDELMSNLDYSSNEELEDFDPSAVADDLIDQINSR